MRGKAEAFAVADFFVGITPAYAGKSCNQHLKKSRKIGSPPPMRGKDLYKISGVNSTRITPAYAGKSVHTQFLNRQF